MKILIATYGSRGDVQPYIALGKGLQEAGHDVLLGTSNRFEDVIRKNGIEYGYMSDDLLAIIDTDQGKELLEGSTNFFRSILQSIKLARQVKPLQVKLLYETWEIAKKKGPDFIIYHPKAIAAPHIAEKLGIGCAMATPIPLFVPTSERQFPVFPDLKLGRYYNLLSYKFVNFISRIFIGKYIRGFRKNIGLSRLQKFDLIKSSDGKDIPVIHCLSESVLPRPADWPDSAYITGYWFLNAHSTWKPPQELSAFLKEGTPPIYIGFGSMAGRKPERLAEIAVDALQLIGRRGILATGWGGLKLETLPDSIMQIKEAPHEWLFQQVAAVVHHGGAGTTAAGLRAGKPTVIIPFFVDQPFWGRQVYELGAGTKPIPLKKLTAEKLAQAITKAISDPTIQRKSAIIGNKIRQENGIKNAITVIEELIIKRRKMN